jgi:3-phenylpropionate/trans-cinnamate dioxygenase ferredoxin subunit
MADLDDGGRLIVEVAGRSIGIFRIGRRLYALRNRCPHAGGELCRGRIVARLSSARPGHYVHDRSRPLIVCPWHGWEFDLATGQSQVDPRRVRVRAYDVEALRGEEIGAGPYRAETVQVSVEDEYLVVTLAGPGEDGRA